MFYALLIGLSAFSAVMADKVTGMETITLLHIVSCVIIVLLWMSSLATSSLFFHRAKKHMYIAKVGMNPFKLIWRVVGFAWRNKFPLNGSAFTYCEVNNLSRLDLGKEQYGGPFTTYRLDTETKVQY